MAKPEEEEQSLGGEERNTNIPPPDSQEVLNLAGMPEEAVPLSSQVAGHSAHSQNCTVGMLKHRDGYVLKPINRPDLGFREIAFYEMLQTTDNIELQRFKQFVPEYYGTIELNVKGKNITFLKFADLTAGLKEPCIMDLKIGEKTYEPNATHKKQQDEDNKYIACKKEFGFCIPGFQVYRLATGKLERYAKDFGKNLNKESLPEALNLFFNMDSGYSYEMMLPILRKLRPMLHWCRSQRSVHIYSSSVFIAYDAAALRHTRPSIVDPSARLYERYNAKKYKPFDDSAIRVNLIDFAHVHPANGKMDKNYVRGFENLVYLLEELMLKNRNVHFESSELNIEPKLPRFTRF